MDSQLTSLTLGPARRSVDVYRAAGGKACRPRSSGIGAGPGHIEQRKPITSDPTVDHRVMVDGAARHHSCLLARPAAPQVHRSAAPKSRAPHNHSPPTAASTAATIHRKAPPKAASFVNPVISKILRSRCAAALLRKPGPDAGASTHRAKPGAGAPVSRRGGPSSWIRAPGRRRANSRPGFGGRAVQRRFGQTGLSAGFLDCA